MKRTTLLIIFIIFEIALHWPSSASADKQKVLYVDSYHAEYQPSIIMHMAVRAILEPANIQLKFVYMDAKRKKSDELLRNAALRVKDVIEDWQPDLVIAADDAASKYLVKPYYRNADLPFVFIGVNWNVEQYGYPYKNVTGQIEVELVHELITELKKYSSGSRIGLLAGRTFTDQKALKHYQDVLNIRFDKVKLVDDFGAWKASYKSLQDEVDILLFRNNSGIADWNAKDAKAYIREHTAIPTGTVSTHLYPLVLLSYVKVNNEFGEYGARTALQILRGTSPAQIPISTNKQAKVFLNMDLAKKLDIKFPMELIERAHLVSDDHKKLLYINSYHKGYKWSDDIEKGLLKVLGIELNPDDSYNSAKNNDVQFRVFRMNTKMNKSETFKKQAALSAKNIIEEWQPDIVVASDDNASKYLIVPYFKNTEIPFVFCGLNWDASVYGFPASNITGMVEVDPILETIELLKKYAKGNRVGYIGANRWSERKSLQYYKEKLNISFAEGKLVNDFTQWKNEYLRLQDDTDMLILLGPTGIKDWSDDKAEEFILKHTKIPTGSTTDDLARYALLGMVKIAEEQGWWAGKTALRLLAGTSPANIPITVNKESKVILNMQLAKRLGIKFPMDLLEQATFVGDIPK